MKNISELTDASIYESFALTTIDGNVNVSFYTSEGNSLYQSCDIFTFDGGSLIAFKRKQKEEIHRHDVVVSNGDSECRIQGLCYENSLDILSGEKSYPYTIYTYTNSVNVTPEALEQSGIKDGDHTIAGFVVDKCYHESWGPLTFYSIDSGYPLKKLRVVFSVSGCAAIIRIDTDDTEIKNKGSRSINASARSIRGVFKTIDEWNSVSQEPFNNTELPAVKANDFLIGLGFSDELMSEIISDVPEMRVAQYLRGTTLPLGELVEDTSVPENLKYLMLKNMRYRTLETLLANHPDASMVFIESSVVDEQKTYIETKIFQFLVENFIDVNTADISDTQSIFSKMTSNNSGVRTTEFIELCEARLGYI